MAKPAKKKILVNVYKPLRAKLNERVDTACLQRDAYLDRVLSHEASVLEKELPAPNSSDARAHLAAHLGLLDRTQMNLALHPETVEAINTACENCNVPRDAFINRVLLFLVTPNKQLFERMLGIDISWYYVNRVLFELNHEPPLTPWHLEGSLSVIEDMVNEDPFWAIRACIEAARKEEDYLYDSLHAALITKDFFRNVPSSLGFNCYLPDEMIEGHPAQIAAQKELEALFEGWEDDSESRSSPRGSEGTIDPAPDNRKGSAR